MDPNWDSSLFDAGTLDCLLCKASLEYVNGDKSDLLNHLNNVHQTKVHHNLILAITFLDNKTLNDIIIQFEKHSVFNDEGLLEEIDSDQETVEIYETNGQKKENDIEEGFNEEENDFNAIDYLSVDINEMNGQEKENEEDNEGLLEEISSNEETVEMNDTNGQEKSEDIIEVKKASTSHGVNHISDVICEHCNYKTTKRGEYQRHLKSVHKVILFDCEHCDYMTSTRSNYKLHNNSVHGGLNIKCEHCSFKATRQGSLEQHMRTVHIEELIPPFLGNLWNHLSSNDTTPIDVVKTEGKKRQRPDNLGRNILKRRVISKESEEIVEVKTESEVFVNKNSTPSCLNQSKQPVAAFNCVKCGYKDSNQDNLLEHLMSAHVGITFNCDQCDYKNTNQSNLQQHIKSVHKGVN